MMMMTYDTTISIMDETKQKVFTFSFQVNWIQNFHFPFHLRMINAWSNISSSSSSSSSTSDLNKLKWLEPVCTLTTPLLSFWNTSMMMSKKDPYCSNIGHVIAADLYGSSSSMNNWKLLPSSVFLMMMMIWITKKNWTSFHSQLSN